MKLQLIPTQSIPIGESVANYLVSIGVQHVFGFPGETSLPLYIGMQRTAGIQHILARCPRCAGYMADSYARLSGRIGVCDAPGGIGSPFVAPALHEAKNSSIPLVLIASGVARTKRGKWSTSECNQQGLFKAITKQTVMLDDEAGLLEELDAAFQTAMSPRTGPVFVEIPADVFAAASPSTTSLLHPTASTQYPALHPTPDQAALAQAGQLIRQATSPVVVAGGGTHLSGATSLMHQLAEGCRIPVATTLNGKGSFNECHALALGVTGAKGNLETNRFIQAADCVLVLGSKLGDKSTDGYAFPQPGQRVIHVDSDPNELQRSASGYVPILSDIKLFCEVLIDQLADFTAPEQPLPDSNPFWELGLTNHLCELLSSSLSSHAVVIADASVASGWAGAAIRFSSSHQRLITPRGSGSIGFALPAAIGAAFARPTSQIIAIGGDGGLAIAMHEMETAVRYHLPIVYFLLNNQRLGLIDRHLTELQNGHAISDRFTDIDWIQIGQAMGWQSIRITSIDELNHRWSDLMSTDQPTLVELQIPATEMAPDFFIARQKHGK